MFRTEVKDPTRDEPDTRRARHGWHAYLILPVTASPIRVWGFTRAAAERKARRAFEREVNS